MMHPIKRLTRGILSVSDEAFNRKATATVLLSKTFSVALQFVVPVLREVALE